MKKDKEETGNCREKHEPVHEYIINSNEIYATVSIKKMQQDSVYTYELKIPKINVGTAAFLEDIKIELLKKLEISSQEALDIKMAEQLEHKFSSMAKEMLREKMPHLSEDKLKFICGRIVQEMLGLGDIEFFLKDDDIEEICVNGANQPIWIYHRKYGWIKSNLELVSDNQIWNYSSSIARRVGRQINTQSPLLDAYLPTGDRVNATLAPISSAGNTITIRKFARKPWAITDHIESKTISPEVAATLWLAIQYEANAIISGGTGSGKTSMLNVLSGFIPQNQRVVSIEQTKEITLPSYLQWVPMVVRLPTNEGKSGIDMLDLMVNSLRMRPDRIIVGEIRRSEEAEVLFEAMHTGHSVYATLHAETVSETLRRLMSPPIDIPPVMIESLHLIVTMYRDRRSGRRRIFEIGEIVFSEEEEVKTNIIYRWRPSVDALLPDKKSIRLMEMIMTYANMSESEIKKDINEKKRIIEWIHKKGINTVNEVGKIVSEYYDDPSRVLEMVNKK